MPSTTWMKERRQQTFWLTPDEEALFAAACKAKGVTKSEALRDVVRLMLSTLEAQDA